MSFTVVKLLDRLNPTIITGGFVPRGTYDNATDYAVGDSVDYNGSSYVMFSNASAGTLPTDTDYWQVVANGGVSSVNTKSGIVVIDPDDLNDTSTTNKFTTAGDISKLAGIEALADVTDTTNVTAAGALMDSELTSLSGVKTLTLPDSTTISTFGATLTDDTDAATARTTLGLTAGGAGDIWVEKAGDTMTGDLIFSGSQKIIGGSGTTSDLTLQTTSGVGATGADMHFLVGNNGATEAMTILNSGFVGIGKIAPTVILDVVGASATTLTRTVAGAASPDSAIQIGLQETTPTNGGGPSFLFFGNNAAGTKSFIGRLSAIWENVAVGSETGAIAFHTRANSADTTASTERMRITSTGNVGIGTTSPNKLLELSAGGITGGSLRITSTNTTVNAGESFGEFDFYSNDVSTGGTGVSGFIKNIAINAGVESALTFGTRTSDGTGASTEKMRITSTGNVGIGTTDPGSKLEVNGNIRISYGSGGTLTIPETDNTRRNRLIQGADSLGAYINATFSTGGSAVLRLQTATTERMRIDGSGNVGIGTTAPGSKLELYTLNGTSEMLTLYNDYATTNNNGIIFNSKDSGGTKRDFARIVSTRNSAKALLNFQIDNDNNLNTGVTLINALTIAGGGNVGIGTTAPSAKLMIDGSADDEQLIVQAHSTQTANLTEWQNSSGTVLSSIKSNGKLAIGTTGGSYSVEIASVPTNATDFTIYSTHLPQATSNGTYSWQVMQAVTNPTISSGITNSGDLTGVFFNILRRGASDAGTLATLQSSKFQYGHLTGLNSSAVTTNVYGFLGSPLANAGTITNMYDIFLTAATTGGTVTNKYGLYIQNQTVGGTSNYAILTNAGNIVFNEGGDASTDFRVEGDTDANLLFTDASADTVQIGASTTADSAKFYVSGKISTSGEMEINGALNHDGTTVGLYGVTPVARASAYTQTYSTAARTVNPASTASFIGIDNLQVGSVYATVTDLNQLRTDLLQAMQLINSLVDDSQAIGISQ